MESLPTQTAIQRRTRKAPDRTRPMGGIASLATSRGARAHGRRGHHARARDRGLANGDCRGPRGPNGLRAFPSLLGSGRSVDASNRLLHTEDAPNVPEPTCNGGPLGSNIRLSKRSPRLVVVQAPHKRSLVAASRCIRKSALNSARR
jgi:hypothetical protein